MDLATGAMGSLLPKLAELLHEEYNLQTSVKNDVESLAMELTSMEAALSKVAEVPRDQLDRQVRLWADHVRELSYEMEDVVDSFMVRVEGNEPAADLKRYKRFKKKIANFFKKGKTRHQIADKIQQIKVRVKLVADLRDRYKLDDVGGNAAATSTVDPRIFSLFKDQRDLIGIEEPRNELIERLKDGDDGVPNSRKELRILSIFGFGGLGKTTLAKSVYNVLRPQFDSGAFVSVGRNPDMKSVLKEIFLEVDEKVYVALQASTLDETQLVKQLQRLLQNKRYFIVIDDIWDTGSWEKIRCALMDNSCGSRIITTTRIYDVAGRTGEVYRLKPLSPARSEELFNARLFGGKSQIPYGQPGEVSAKILEKCDGVPLAIITIASLLAGKPKEDWPEVYNSVGFGDGDNIDVDNTRKILKYSYHDLPCHLRTCLLHLTIFPEDHEINKDTLIWMWIAEGFIPGKPGTRLFELGEKYFNELINKSMIQPIEKPYKSVIYACRVHDLVLDMIYSMSKEENFVVVLSNDEQHTCPPSNARRLAVQKRDIEQQDPVANTPMPQVRSFNATLCHFSVMIPLLSSFEVLRVLALDGCTFTEGSCHLVPLGRLLQLRYLGLSGESITELPSQIGDLRLLQILDLWETGIKQLPRSVGLLRQLKCLRLRGIVSNWIENLTSLEELWLKYVPLDIIKELGKLTELRKLYTEFHDHRGMLFKNLMECLGSLQKLQDIDVSCYMMNLKWDNREGYVPPRHLGHLNLRNAKLRRLPAWINSSRLPNLTHLCLNVNSLEVEDVEILGRFPELISLELQSWKAIFFPDIQGGGAFPKLRHFLTCAMPRFLQGAMPRLEYVGYVVSAGCLNSDFASLGNVAFLQKVAAFIPPMGTGMDGVEAALRHATEIHPNSPTFEVDTGVLYHHWAQAWMTFFWDGRIDA